MGAGHVVNEMVCSVMVVSMGGQVVVGGGGGGDDDRGRFIVIYGRFVDGRQ